MPQRIGPAMAVTCAVAVATIYFIQPLLRAVERAFPGSPWATLAPTLTQLGYAAGLFTLVPLGDKVDRRKLILAQLAGLSLALLGAAVAPSAVLFGAASLVVVFSPPSPSRSCRWPPAWRHRSGGERRWAG